MILLLSYISCFLYKKANKLLWIYKQKATSTALVHIQDQKEYKVVKKSYLIKET